MGSTSRRKGHNFERETAAWLRGHIPCRCAPALTCTCVRRGLTQSGGAVEPDVVAPHVWIECKVGPMPNPRAALAQAERDVAAHAPHLRPVAIVKDNGAGPRPPKIRVVMDAERWAEMYAAALETWERPLCGES